MPCDSCHEKIDPIWTFTLKCIHWTWTIQRNKFDGNFACCFNYLFVRVYNSNNPTSYLLDLNRNYNDNFVWCPKLLFLKLRMYCIDTEALVFMFNGGSSCGLTINFRFLPGFSNGIALMSLIIQTRTYTKHKRPPFGRGLMNMMKITCTLGLLWHLILHHLIHRYPVLTFYCLKTINLALADLSCLILSCGLSLKISSVLKYFVACQRGGVSRKPPDLKAATRHSPLTL